MLIDALLLVYCLPLFFAERACAIVDVVRRTPTTFANIRHKPKKECGTCRWFAREMLLCLHASVHASIEIRREKASLVVDLDPQPSLLPITN